MPEGHTIHRAARDHARDLAGRLVRVSSPQGRFELGKLVDASGRARLGRVEAYGNSSTCSRRAASFTSTSASSAGSTAARRLRPTRARRPGCGSRASE